jgi:microcompartment protein CcmL/EutN
MVAVTALDLRYLHIRVRAKARVDAAQADDTNPSKATATDAVLRDAIAESAQLASEMNAMLDDVVTPRVRDRLSRVLTMTNEGAEYFEGVRSEMAAHVARERIVAEGGIEVTARQLFKDFDANEIAALQKYNNRKVIVSGKVTRISADFLDKPTVHLATGNMFKQVLVTGVSTDVAAGLKKGQKFTASCEKVTEALGSPICHF